LTYARKSTFYGCTVLNENVFANLIRLIEKNAIAPLVAATFPLENIVNAQKHFLEKKYIGKIVLMVN